MAGPPPHFVPEALMATAGDVVFFLDNVSSRPHTLAIGPRLHDPIVVSDFVEMGTAAVFTVRDLGAGEYIIWCTIGDHASLGQVGTLTVD